MLCALIILGFISLVGRKDLGLRIPSVLEGIVILLMSSRILTSLMGIDKIQTSPFEFSTYSWSVPVWSLEIFLVMAVLLFDWVESERLKRDLSDHRGAAGRFGWSAMVVVISFGIAGILACLLAIRNSIRWIQPAVIVGVGLFLPFSWNALGNWVTVLDGTTPSFIIAIGLISVIASVYVVISNNQVWLAATLFCAHLLIPSGSFGYYEQSSVLLMSSIVLLSTTSWLIGIVTLRRSWRIMGAIDLVIAWIVAGFLLLGGASESTVLIMLIVTAILLGLVTWLGQKYEQEISNT